MTNTVRWPDIKTSTHARNSIMLDHAAPVQGPIFKKLKQRICSQCRVGH